MPPNVTVQAVTNQYLAPRWMDLILRDNYFFGKLMQKTKKWNGSQMLFPKLIQHLRSLRNTSAIALA